MAEIYHSKKSSNRKKLNQAQRMRAGFLLIGLAVLYLFYQNGNPTEPISIIVTGFFLMMAVVWQARYSKVKKELQRKRKVLERFRQLPDSYHVFEDVPVQFENRGYTVDILVVTPRCNFAIMEVGEAIHLEGDTSHDLWTVLKQDRKGKVKKIDTYFPVSLLRQQVWHSSKMWQAQGANVWVEGSLFFSDPDASVKAKTDTITVFDDQDAFFEYLTLFQPPFLSSPQGQEQMIKSIKKTARAKKIAG